MTSDSPLEATALCAFDFCGHVETEHAVNGPLCVCGHDRHGHRVTRINSVPAMYCYACAKAVPADVVEHYGEAAYDDCAHEFRPRTVNPRDTSDDVGERLRAADAGSNGDAL